MSERAPHSPVTLLAGFGLFLAMWPVLIVHVAYGISIAEGFVPFCNPYWDGCTSISRAARHGWANHLFKAAMLPYAVLLALHWWLNHHWLGAAGGGSRAMLLCGWLGALFLVLYATFLGTEGAVYQMMRRHGINVYFGATFIAQLLLIARLSSLAARGPVPWPSWLAPALLAIAVGVLSMGLLFVAIDLGLPLDRNRLQNTLEWVAALLMQVSMLLATIGWRASGLHLRFGCANVPASRGPWTGDR